jgi:hypothetical protein
LQVGKFKEKISLEIMAIMAIFIGIGIWDLGKNFTGDYGNYGNFSIRLIR